MTPEEAELLNELTIIIPTYNRPLELERAIEYWRDTPVNVHILDGSERPWFPLGPIESIPTVNYHHIPAKKDLSRMENYYQRIFYGSKLPVTKFSAFGSDDDFYTISGLISSIKVLKSQKNIDAVAGRILTYEQEKKLLWHHKYVPRTGRTDLETESIEEKLNTRSTWFLWAICKTDPWKAYLVTCFEETGFSKVMCYAHEWLSVWLSKAMFRTRYIDVIQLVRRDNIAGWNQGPETPWEHFVCDSQNAEVIEEIARQFAKGFNAVTPLSEHPKNLELAREQMRLERIRASKSGTALQESKTPKSVLGNILFFFLPGLDIFWDRPRRLKYVWRNPKFQYSAKEQQEVEEIEKLLLMPREELRLRANI